MADGTTHPAPRQTRRALAKAATARKVLDAALAEFVVGYDKATIRGIAARAGMSTGAIFANYADKAALYRAAFGHDPITPELGRELLCAGRQMLDDHQTSAQHHPHHILVPAAAFAALRSAIAKAGA